MVSIQEWIAESEIDVIFLSSRRVLLNYTSSDCSWIALRPVIIRRRKMYRDHFLTREEIYRELNCEIIQSLSPPTGSVEWFQPRSGDVRVTYSLYWDDNSRPVSRAQLNLRYYPPIFSK